MSAPSPDAIVLTNVAKAFKKTSRKRDHTTFKSEFVRLLKGQRKVIEPATHIEALKGVDLRIPRGQTVGIIGRNGSGKSTLLKLITGIYSPSSGTVEVNGRISALLELGAGFHPDFTGRENIFINGIILGMSRAELKDRIEGIIEFAELGDFIDEPVRTYSSGMFMRLAFAVATHVDPEILIVDEILSVGDEHFSRKSQAKMSEFRRGGRTIVLVSHDLNTMQSWCDAVAWIDGGRIRAYGHPAQVVGEYRRAIQAAETEEAKTGHSALSVPGLALPASGPVAEEAPPLATVREVRVLDAGGVTPKAFGPDASVGVEVDFTLRAPAPTTVTVDLLGADGRLVFSTARDLGPCSGPGRVRLDLERLGLVGGVYEVVVAVSGNGEVVKNPTRRGLHVEAPTDVKGLLRPRFQWSHPGGAAP
jgi:lipopolysaccharide transport system ATP-binding protein